jgi:hypothetical protein
MRLVRALLVLVVCVAVPLPAPAQSKGKPASRTVFVGVVDRGGAPVLDLGPGDFDVTEDAVKRPVLSASLAKSPMRIALVIDTSDSTTPALNHLRAGLVGFLDALAPQHEVLIVSTGRQSRVRVAPTLDRKKLRDTCSGLFSDGGATILSDTLLEIDDRFMRKAEDRWPVFVIVTADGAEGSSPANEKKLNEWVRALPARGVAAHAIALKYRGGGNPEIIASHVAMTTGGSYDFINTSNSVPEKLKAIAERLTHDYQRASAKYQVTFASDSPAGALVVGVARDGVTIETTVGRLR